MDGPYLGKKQLKKNRQLEDIKKETIQNSRQLQAKQVQLIYANFQKNLQEFASKYKEQINRDPDFRDKFNELCDKMDVNPMLSRKTIWSELGFGDFYNQLAMQVLDICSKKKNINGGLMKVNDVIIEFRNFYKIKINKNDIERALKTIQSLGGCQMNKDYICTVPIELSGDFTILLDMTEEKGYISSSIMAKFKNWTTQRFNNTIDVLRREGMVWVDKKTGTQEYHFYFPSTLNNYYEQRQLQKKYL